MDRMKTLRKTIRDAIVDQKLPAMPRHEFQDLDIYTAKQLIGKVRTANPTPEQSHKLKEAFLLGKLPEQDNKSDITYFQAKRLLRKAERAKISPQQMKVIQKGMEDGKLKRIPPEDLLNMTYKKAEKVLKKLSRLYRKDIKRAEKALRLPDLLAKAEKAKEMLKEIKSATGQTMMPVMNAFDHAIG